MMRVLDPMLASLEEARLDDEAFVYEPKYDGIRAIADVGPRGVRLWSRLGNEKTKQFPEVVQALTHWARKHPEPLVLDGELVALDPSGEPIGFQHLQGRIHIKEIVQAVRARRSGHRKPAAMPPSPGSPAVVPTAFIAFDLLRVGSHDLRELPLTDRREALERIFRKTGSPILRLSEQVRGDGRALYKRALDGGWEGLIAKRASSRYRSGKRSPDWRKIKIVHEQEFVIGGWTEPRQSRTYFGALVLGVFEVDTPASGSRKKAAAAPLRYVGHVGTGFDHRELERVWRLLEPLEIKTCPFIEEPPTNEHEHWVTPELVAMVRFTEWTSDGILRHPVYLGLRDDKRAIDVRREPTTASQRKTARTVRSSNESSARPSSARPSSSRPRSSGPSSRPERAPSRPAGPDPAALAALVDQLQHLERHKKDGVLELGEGRTLKVTNLHKVFWPKGKLTKGDLFRYYVSVSPFVLPTIADRPLVMKRFPNGVGAQPFYQHRMEQQAPAGVRIEEVASADARPQVIGGDLLTLLYTTQLAAISQDPWFSRVQSPGDMDFVAFDLDPSPGVAWKRVLAVALAVRDELTKLGASAVVKTSGSEGLHIYTRLPPHTPYEVGLLFAQIVATLVAERNPKDATIERSVRARGQKVYVDYLQNIQGKTLASAYSARASEHAGVSTPLTWKEVEQGVDHHAWTIETVPERLRKVGDLWAPLATARPVDLARITSAGRS